MPKGSTTRLTATTPAAMQREKDGPPAGGAPPEGAAWLLGTAGGTGWSFSETEKFLGVRQGECEDPDRDEPQSSEIQVAETRR